MEGKVKADDEESSQHKRKKERRGQLEGKLIVGCMATFVPRPQPTVGKLGKANGPIPGDQGWI